MAIVSVKPIERQRWHGKVGRDSFARPIVLEALVNVNTGRYDTGLTEKEEEELSALTGYNLSPIYVNGKAHEFWNAGVGQIKLEHKTNIFDTSRPLENIKVKVLKKHPLVATSIREYEEGKFPDAVFVIEDEVEETKVRAERAAVKRKVVLEGAKLTNSRKVEIIQILLGVNGKKQSEDWLDLKIDEAVEKEGAEKVLTLMLRDKERTSLHALVLEALHKNILRKDGSAVYYMDDQIGFDLESAIDYMQDKKNQVFKATILEKLG